MGRRRVDRVAAIVFAALCLIVAGTCVIAFSPMWRGARVSAEDVSFDDPAAAVRDARTLIADRNRNPASSPLFTEPEALPPSLRIRRLRYAKVHEDHVDLVIARSPDGSAGARIWSVRHRPHRDQPTRYRDIWFYRYTHEAAESPGNVP